MKIEKLPSGSFRVRKTIDKKTVTVVFSKKPTQREIAQALEEKVAAMNQFKGEKGTFLSYANKYIDTNKNVLSPSTIKSYDSIIRNLSEDFKNTRINDFDQDTVQKEINDYSVNRSPKTVRNAHGFISKVLSVYIPNFKYSVNLPQKIIKETYVPTPEEVKKIIEDVKGTDYEIPFRLATYGLRKSEIISLKYPDSLDGNILMIDSAKVYDIDNNWVEKTTKTEHSIREVYLSDELVELINDNKCFYNGYPNNLVRHLHRVQNKLGIQTFRLHDLRGYFATELSQAGISEADILKIGGWSKSNADVMKRVYRHSRIQDNLESMKNVSKTIGF